MILRWIDQILKASSFSLGIWMGVYNYYTDNSNAGEQDPKNQSAG